MDTPPTSGPLSMPNQNADLNQHYFEQLLQRIERISRQNDEMKRTLEEMKLEIAHIKHNLPLR